MADDLLRRRILFFEDRDTWIAAYAAWYRHFLDMQPVQDRYAHSWAKKMTEASLPALRKRDDQDEIRRAALGPDSVW